MTFVTAQFHLIMREITCDIILKVEKFISDIYFQHENYKVFNYINSLFQMTARYAFVFIKWLTFSLIHQNTKLSL
jgi:hypothetical protein